MSIKIFYKNDTSAFYDDSKPLLPQIQGAGLIEVDTRKDFGRMAEEFLGRLISVNAFSMCEPFEIRVYRNSNISEIRAQHVAKRINKDMIMHWALNQTVCSLNRCEHKLAQMLEMVKER